MILVSLLLGNFIQAQKEEEGRGGVGRNRARNITRSDPMPNVSYIRGHSMHFHLSQQYSKGLLDQNAVVYYLFAR